MKHESPRVEGTLADAEIHDRWISNYRTADNQAFFERAFDALLPYLGRAESQPVLDAGCGTGAHSLRLAARGCRVIGTDISFHVLRSAKAGAEARKQQNNVQLSASNLLELPFADESFRAVLCWGVLMHVPDVGGAVRELSRVLAPNGCLVVSEANARSVQATGLRAARRLLNRNLADIRHTASGVEHWKMMQSGPLVTREANIGWLIEEFERHGVTLQRRRAGQLTELYTRTRNRVLRSGIHAINRIWFDRVRLPGPAFGNLLILRKDPR